MHSCFAWVGTGAFTAKSHVLHFLSTLSSSSFNPPSSPSYADSGLLDSLHDNSSISPPYTSQELAHADNSFTTLLNKPPYVLSSSRLDQLPSKFGHSDGEGIERNKRFIVRQPSLFLFPLFRCCNEIDHSSPIMTTVSRNPAPYFTAHHFSPFLIFRSFPFDTCQSSIPSSTQFPRCTASLDSTSTTSIASLFASFAKSKSNK